MYKFHQSKKIFSFTNDCFQENKIDRNEFSHKSESVWSSMGEVNSCDVLCKPVGGKGGDRES